MRISKNFVLYNIFLCVLSFYCLKAEASVIPLPLSEPAIEVGCTVPPSVLSASSDVPVYLTWIQRIESLYTAFLLRDTPFNVCSLDNSCQDFNTHEIDRRSSKITYACAILVPSLATTDKQKILALSKARVNEISERKQIAAQRITDLTCLKNALLSGGGPTLLCGYISGIDVSDINAVNRGLTLVKIYREELVDAQISWVWMRDCPGLK